MSEDTVKLQWRQSDPKWFAYPYSVVLDPLTSMWAVRWEYRTAGVSRRIGPLFDNPEDARSYAQKHAEKHGGEPHPR